MACWEREDGYALRRASAAHAASFGALLMLYNEALELALGLLGVPVVECADRGGGARMFCRAT